MSLKLKVDSRCRSEWIHEFIINLNLKDVIQLRWTNFFSSLGIEPRTVSLSDTYRPFRIFFILWHGPTKSLNFPGWVQTSDLPALAFQGTGITTYATTLQEHPTILVNPFKVVGTQIQELPGHCPNLASTGEPYIFVYSQDGNWSNVSLRSLRTLSFIDFVCFPSLVL